MLFLNMMSESRPSGVGPPGKYLFRSTESKLPDGGLQTLLSIYIIFGISKLLIRSYPSAYSEYD